MKIVFAGTWSHPVYQQTLSETFRSLDVNVVPFNNKEIIRGRLGFIERYLNLRGPLTRKAERALLELCRKEKPDVLFIWQYDTLSAKLLEQIKRETGAKAVCYTNDDPFSPLYQKHFSIYAKRRWKRFFEAIPVYDQHFVFREHNIKEFMEYGAKAVEVLPMYYNSKVHYPRTLSTEEHQRFDCDVVFIGYLEEGFRYDILKRLLDEGINAKYFGQYGWDKKFARELAAQTGPIQPLWGDDYAKALSAAKMGLCIPSRLNRDEYTTRSFEIPACGSVLLAERTPTHQRLYKEDEEAVFFSTADEMVAKVKALLAEPQRIRQIAEQGHQRLLKDGHSEIDRANTLLACFKRLTNG